MNVKDIIKCRKIAIFGWPATGKSTLANYLNKKLKIDVYALDLIRWKNSVSGIKDDEKFLLEYNNILNYDKWIIEGNALDWIHSRLEQADLLIFFDSTVENCIANYNAREERIKNAQEKRLAFDETKTVTDTVEWIKNRYSKKIEKLRVILNDYHEKLIVINDFDELESIMQLIDEKSKDIK